MNRKRAAIFLFGGVLVIGLLIGGYLQNTRTISGLPVDNSPLNCLNKAGLYCNSAQGTNISETVNISKSENCQVGPDNAEKVRELDTVESVNESTGIVKCKTG